MEWLKNIKSLRFVLVFALIILIMMILRILNLTVWPGKAGKAAEIAAHQTSFITRDQLLKNPEMTTLIKIGNMKADSGLATLPTVDVAMPDLMGKDFLKKIREPGRQYVILSPSRSESIKAWIMLNQMDVKNLGILETDGPGSELLKYRFQPDTTFRLEPEEDNK